MLWAHCVRLKSLVAEVGYNIYFRHKGPNVSGKLKFAV